MNYYLIEGDKPGVYLRYYKNTRVAIFARDKLNQEAGYHRYDIASDDEPVINVSVSSSFNVDHLAPAGQVASRLS